ncbi:MAG: hypothetical protein U5K73_12280 [Halofilum sp. (in: g-proteobacteria)]|nr:hypothetical protein [Halofilum sp. (in: g-proteobacteria)]
MSDDRLLVDLFTIAGIWGLLALSLNLQFGITGLINSGQIAFFMLGAYTSTIVTHPDRVWTFDPPRTAGGHDRGRRIRLPDRAADGPPADRLLGYLDP